MIDYIYIYIYIYYYVNRVIMGNTLYLLLETYFDKHSVMKYFTWSSPLREVFSLGAVA